MQTLTLTDSRPSGSNSARSTTRPIPHNGGNLVAHGYELLRLCCPSRPSLEHLLNGPAERGDSMAGSRLNGPWGLTYTTSGSMTSTGNPRKSLVEAANDLHGLLRHPYALDSSSRSAGRRPAPCERRKSLPASLRKVRELYSAALGGLRQLV